MTIVAMPLDAVSGSPSYTAKMFRQTLGALSGPAYPGRPLGAFSGVRPGTPSSTVSVTSTTYSVAPHSGQLDLETPADTAAYAYAVTVTETGTITSASASNPRIDLLTVRINDPAVDSSSTPSGSIQYYAGTPAASPATPSTPAGEMALATIAVPKSGTGSPSATWVAPTAGKVWWQARQFTSTTTLNSSWNTIPFDTLDIAYFGAPAIGGGSFRCPVDGVYNCSAVLGCSSGVSGTIAAQFAQNGTRIDGSQVALPAGAGVTRLPVPEFLLQCSVGDIISLQANCSSGSGPTTNNPSSRMTIILV